MKAATRAFTLLLLLLSASFAQAQDLGKPMLLVAQPGMNGPYSNTALIVVPMGDKHMGFILNRATETRLASAFPEHGPSKAVTDPIFFGGPEASDALFAVLPRNPGEPSIHLFGDLWVTGNGKAIDRIIETSPNEARYFAGFVGWLPDELAKEIAQGYWLVGDADPAQIFRKDFNSMWEDLVTRLGKGKFRKPGDRDAQLDATVAPPA